MLPLHPRHISKNVNTLDSLPACVPACLPAPLFSGPTLTPLFPLDALLRRPRFSPFNQVMPALCCCHALLRPVICHKDQGPSGGVAEMLNGSCKGPRGQEAFSLSRFCCCVAKTVVLVPAACPTSMSGHLECNLLDATGLRDTQLLGAVKMLWVHALATGHAAAGFDLP